MNQTNQMTQMLGQMMMWPMNMFADMFARSMQGMQGMGMQGMQAMPCMPCPTVSTSSSGSTSSSSHGGSTGSSSSCTTSCATEDRYLSCPPRQLEGSCGTSSDWSCRDRCDDGWSSDRGGCGCGCGCNRCRSGDCCGRSSCHSGSDKVYLVEYSIVNLGRSEPGSLREERGSYEVRCRQRVVRECMTCEEFKNWVIVDYVREHPWVSGKNLRVYVKVLDCWCKEDWDYEEEQIHVLKQIRNAIRGEDREDRDQDRDRDRDRDRPYAQEADRDRDRDRDRDTGAR